MKLNCAIHMKDYTEVEPREIYGIVILLCMLFLEYVKFTWVVDWDAW